MTNTLTEAELGNIQRAIEKDPASAEDIKQKFCQHWPLVKEVLQYMREFPKLPSAGKAAIDIVVSIGDWVFSRSCGT